MYDHFYPEWLIIGENSMKHTLQSLHGIKQLTLLPVNMRWSKSGWCYMMDTAIFAAQWCNGSSVMIRKSDSLFPRFSRQNSGLLTSPMAIRYF